MKPKLISQIKLIVHFNSEVNEVIKNQIIYCKKYYLSTEPETPDFSERRYQFDHRSM